MWQRIKAMMASSASPSASASASAPVVETAAPSARRGGLIPCGTAWERDGRSYYKVPQEQMRVVLFTLPTLDVGQLTDQKLAQAQAYCETRYREKGQRHFVYPVRSTKQSEINDRYWSSLRQFSAAVRQERQLRSQRVVVGA